MCIFKYTCTFPREFSSTNIKFCQWNYKTLKMCTSLPSQKQETSTQVTRFLSITEGLQSFMRHEQRWTTRVCCSHQHKKSPTKSLTSHIFLWLHPINNFNTVSVYHSTNEESVQRREMLVCILWTYVFIKFSVNVMSHNNRREKFTEKKSNTTQAIQQLVHI